jgi:hypothetical protein
MHHTSGQGPCPDHWYGTDPWYGGFSWPEDEPWQRGVPRHAGGSRSGGDPRVPGRDVGRRGPRAGQMRPPVQLTRWGRQVVGIGMASAVLAGLAMVVDGLDGGGGPPQPTAAAAPSPDRRPSGGAVPLAALPPPTALPVLSDARPTRIRIPSIGVDAPLMGVGLGDNGQIQTPPLGDKNLAAWYDGSASPGTDGTSVVVGHVDNMSGPAVFFGLGALKKGKLIEIPRADGTTAVFSVYGVEVFPKSGFPSERVYGDTGRPELRVITCGGSYSKATGYTGNVVVFASLLRAA